MYFFSLSGGYDRTACLRRGEARNLQKLLGVGYARIWANYETGYGGATRCIVYRHLFETRLYASSLVSPIPLARFAGITYSIPIYDIPEPYGGIRIIKG